MQTIDPLFEARQHARRLQADAAAERLRRPSARRVLALAFRRVADRLDPGTGVVPVPCARR